MVANDTQQVKVWSDPLLVQMCTIERPTVADYPAGARLPARVIDDFELVWMLRGRARLTRDGDDDVDLAPGRLVLLPPGVRHGFVWDERRPSRHGYVHFGRDHLPAGPAPPVTLRRMTPDDPLAGLCAHLLWLGRSESDGWRAPAGRALGFLLQLFLSGPLPPPEPHPALPPPLAAAVAHLRREWSQMPLRRIDVGELAGAASVSRSYLSRLFRSRFGLGPSALLERARCSHVETLLARTDLTLDAIAGQCGFADPSHLSHRFTALYGMPPSTYRSGDQTPSVLDHPGVRRLTHLLWE
jgi:AraC family transcriptional regulator